MRNTKISRRQMCRLMAGGAATLALGGNAFAAKKPTGFALNYTLASCMYGTTRIEEILPEVRKIGATAIDLWPRVHGDQREQMDTMGHDRLAELLKQHGVRLRMTTRYDLGPFGLQGEMKILNRFGGSLIVTGCVGPKNLSGPECRVAVKTFVEKLKPHVAAAEEQGVVIGIENHCNALIHTPDSIRYLAEASTSPNLGIALAPYHLPQNADTLAKMIEDLGPKLVHFYAWEHGQGCTKKLPKQQELEQMPGRGTLDFRPIVAALRKINYSDHTEIFMHPTPRGIPILATTELVSREINAARSYLTKCTTPTNS